MLALSRVLGPCRDGNVYIIPYVQGPHRVTETCILSLTCKDEGRIAREGKVQNRSLHFKQLHPNVNVISSCFTCACHYIFFFFGHMSVGAGCGVHLCDVECVWPNVLVPVCVCSRCRCVLDGNELGQGGVTRLGTRLVKNELSRKIAVHRRLQRRFLLFCSHK